MAHNHTGSKRRHLESISSDESITDFDSWARFIVIEAEDHLPIKLNPFAISKAIHGHCGEVKNVTRLRSGSLLIECVRKQQSLNLLSITKFANIPVIVSEHRTLNSCRGIVRDRTRSLSGMSEQEITDELKQQGVSSVKRFTRRKEDSTIEPTNTYLFTFARSSLPRSIKAGYVNIGVEVYVPTPLRCFKCQKFGHGSKTCTRSAAPTSSASCQTDLTWINSEQPVVIPPVIMVDSQTSTSSSTAQAESQTQPVVEHPSSGKSTKSNRKKLNRNQSPRNPVSSEVPVHNTYSAMDMDVTPLSQSSVRSSASSRSRERSPIEPP
ncbi:uncharacterized protein [Haliotis asinina]|uniref:uncharacterized protein n=1 Tax=Haliotis asinina TaxID=109174 RepID=UPI0035318AC4